MTVQRKKFGRRREKIYEVIFKADTPDGKLFDIILMIVIVASVLTVTLESVPFLNRRYGLLFKVLEWIFTGFFTIEYVLRLYSVYRPWKYATSFYGIIDLLAILPSYLSLVIAGSHSLMVIRALRLLRVFRIFKLGSFMRQGTVISRALIDSRSKILVFLYFIFLMVIIIGSLMYFVEGSVNDEFDSIPRSIYWAIVTLTTVGYGDISPDTSLGQFIAALVMILGYAVIAVPTGIITKEIITSSNVNHRVCHHCSREGHDDNAHFCKYCGGELDD